MSVTVTGAKYSSAALSSVGTTTVTVTTTPFVSTDFSASQQRIVALYNSAGTTYKGVAWVRRWVSTSQLELESTFIDISTGGAVTQVAGDTVLVSKNWDDIAQAVITITKDRVILTDNIIFGSSGSVSSLCFYDEARYISSDITGNTNVGDIDHVGGVWIDGHLQDFATAAVYGGSIINGNHTSTSGIPIVYCHDAACIHAKFGGKVQWSNLAVSGYAYWGASLGNPSGSAEPLYMVAMGVEFKGVDVLSRSGGSTWGTPSTKLLINCFHWAFLLYNILVRWANGVNQNGKYKFPGYTNQPLSTFGSDSAGTYNLSTPASQRAVVLDQANGIAFWRSSSNAAQTINITNVVSLNYNAIYNLTLTNWQTNATLNVYFKDTYVGMQASTNLVAIFNGSWTADSRVTSVGSTADVVVFWKSGTGNTFGSQKGPWTIRIRKYGYDEIESTVAEANYSLGTAGTAKNVAFGGAALQVARTTLPAQATADAYAGITVTDHGASPVSWNSKTWSITITVDLATYPSRTAAHVFAYVKSQITKSATWGGKAGDLWHVLVEENPSGVGYITQLGTSGGAGASLKGVRVVDGSDNPLPGFVSMVADDGTTYAPPTTVTVAITCKDAATLSAIASSEVYIEAATGGPLPYNASISITRASTTATVTHTAHGFSTGAKVTIRGATQPEYNGIKTITVVNANSYTYTISGSPASPATGSPTCTAVILQGTADGSGFIQNAGFAYTSSQPISGSARKGTASPFYKSSLISGTITSGGFTATAFAVKDE